MNNRARNLRVVPCVAGMLVESAGMLVESAGMLVESAGMLVES